jgi:hypothetical protein
MGLHLYFGHVFCRDTIYRVQLNTRSIFADRNWTPFQTDKIILIKEKICAF